MKHNYNVHILRCVIYIPQAIHSLLSVLYTLVYMSLSGRGASPWKIKLLCLRLFVNMLCDGKDAIHMYTKFDVYVFYY